MTRTWMLLCLVSSAACGGSPREVSKIRYTSDVSSACPDNTGCELKTGEGEKFIQPDDSREGKPHETVETVVAAKPAEATCANVGIAMAALDLGNYAEEEDRAAAVAKYEDACTRYKFKDTERACLFGVREKWHVAYCVQRLMPEIQVNIVDAKQCALVTAEMRTRLGQYGGGNQQPQWTAQVDALDASCKQDRWPSQLADCARTNFYPYYGTPLMNCHHAMPGWLNDQIKLRIEAAVKVSTKK